MSFPEFKMGDLWAKYWIIQGGMGVRVSWIELVVAVMKAGGVGVLTSVMCGKDDPRFKNPKTQDDANDDALRAAIREVRRRCPDGTLGVNVMVAQTNYKKAVKVAAEEDVDIIFCGSALPLDLPDLIGENKRVKLVPIISSAKAARAICKRWIRDYGRKPDAFVVEGPKAGGHLGFKTQADIDNPNNELEKLVTAVVAEVKNYGNIPIMAAGGIYTGADIYRVMQAGAVGVQLGTRFVTTDECDADIAFKMMFINSTEKDIKIIKSPVQLLGRAFYNDFLRRAEAGEEKPKSCRLKCLMTCNWRESPYCIVNALVNAVEGNIDQGFVFTGTNGYRAEKIIPVAQLIEELVQGYNEAEVAASK